MGIFFLSVFFFFFKTKKNSFSNFSNSPFWMNSNWFAWIFNSPYRQYNFIQCRTLQLLQIISINHNEWTHNSQKYSNKHWTRISVWLSMTCTLRSVFKFSQNVQKCWKLIAVFHWSTDKRILLWWTFELDNWTKHDKDRRRRVPDERENNWLVLEINGEPKMENKKREASEFFHFNG